MAARRRGHAATREAHEPQKASARPATCLAQAVQRIGTVTLHPGEPRMDALAKNWWLIALRGGLAGVFGLIVLIARQDLTLPVLVALFGAYAILDGLAAVVSALRAARRPAESWPVASEGLVSLLFGALALVWPFVPRNAVHVLAGWGALTGVLQLIAAARLPRVRAGHWFLALGGLSSLLLAGLLFTVPHGNRQAVLAVIGVYALVLGALLVITALRIRGGADVLR
jgi:uncharacterized membrane protein HdeD (DUF308 family)